MEKSALLEAKILDKKGLTGKIDISKTAVDAEHCSCQCACDCVCICDCDEASANLYDSNNGNLYAKEESQEQKYKI